MATIAVFGVLTGGGAYAASKIGSQDIAKNAVRGQAHRGEVGALLTGRPRQAAHGLQPDALPGWVADLAIR